MSVTIEKVLSLKQIPLFKTVSNMALSDLMAVSEEQTLKGGEQIIEADKQNKNVYFLLAGTLEENKHEEKKNISAPACVGLESVFLMAPAQINITTKQKSILIKTERDKLYRMMALHPSLAMAILNELSVIRHS